MTKERESFHLNKREAEFILLMLRGYSQEKIAHRFSLSIRTLCFYLKDLQLKLEEYIRRNSCDNSFVLDEKKVRC